MANQNLKIYTVSQVNILIKTVLENNLPGRLTVTGQISDCKVHNRNCYFKLKDEGGVLPCAMWASNLGKLKFRPQDGQAVVATEISMFTRRTGNTNLLSINGAGGIRGFAPGVRAVEKEISGGRFVR